jgi:hypothetical protein
MFESYKQIRTQGSVTTTIMTLDSHSGNSLWRDVEPSPVAGRLQLQEAGGVRRRATFKHLITAGEPYGY